MVAWGEVGDSSQGQLHPQEQVCMFCPKITPPPNIIPPLCYSLDTFSLFYYREEALTKRKPYKLE